MQRGSGQYSGVAIGIAGLAFVGALLFIDPVPERPETGLMAAVAILMAALWLTEALPLAATALIPLVLFPLMGILDGGATSKAYVNPIIFLFVGGFLIALAMERWNLHRRIALAIITRLGERMDYLVLGFMLASAFLSMWISNTATAVMMLPIGLAIVGKIEEAFGGEVARPVSLALLLGIAYGCSIGGVATLVGTPTNLAFVRIYAELFPAAQPIAFSEWLIIGVPYAVLFLGFTWVMLTRVLYRVDRGLRLEMTVLRAEQAKLGRMQYEEKAVLGVFILTVLLWTFRRDLNLGIVVLPGWSGIWGPFERLDDGSIAIATSLMLFFIPARGGVGRKAVLEADVFGRLPWGIILLFGGGFALASGFTASGLSVYLGESLRGLGEVPLWVLVLVICLLVTFLTELTSNTATISMLLPILAAWAVSLQVHPLALAIPATISASMAFMMPVATPPNAVVFGSGRLRIADMARAGLVLNLSAVLLTMVLFYLLFPLLTGDSLSSFPAWAQPGE